MKRHTHKKNDGRNFEAIELMQMKLLITSFQFLWAMSSNSYIKTTIYPNLPRIDELSLSEILFGNIDYTGDWKEAEINAHWMQLNNAIILYGTREA